MQLLQKNGLLNISGLSKHVKMNAEAAAASNNMGVSTKGAPMKPQPLGLNGEAKPKRGRPRGRGRGAGRGGRGRGRPSKVVAPPPEIPNEVFDVEDEFFCEAESDFDQRDADTKSLDSLEQANSFIEDEVAVGSMEAQMKAIKVIGKKCVLKSE